MDNIQSMIVLSVALLAVLPSVMSRKCYMCNSQQNPACADGYQTGQMAYGDCSQGNMYGNQQFPQGGIQPGGIQPGQPGFQNQPGQFGQQGYGLGGDKCIKTTAVGQGINGQPVITRACGSSMMQGMGATSDGCFWQGNIQTCVCDSNYCNSSPKLTTWTKPVAISTGLLTFFASLLARQRL